MRQSRLLAGIFVLAIAGSVQAERTPTVRSPSVRSHGVRPDITVPYTTNGRSTFMIDGKSSPRIYKSPIVDDPKNPGSRPVFNLIFYGSTQAFGDKSNGAQPRR